MHIELLNEAVWLPLFENRMSRFFATQPAYG
jgi:hypothetical protein